MSTHIIATNCPRCGVEESLHIYFSTKPVELQSGEYLACGLNYATEFHPLASLKAVNDRRQEDELPKIHALAEPIKDWLVNCGEYEEMIKKKKERR